MRRRALALLPVIVGMAACAGPTAPPSLLPRAAERIDPRLEVVRPMNERPVDPTLAGRLAALVREARSGDAAFERAAGEAQRLAFAAGAPQSESWVAAEQALSAAVSAREPVARAIGD